MTSTFAFWPCVAGIIFLFLGLVSVRTEVSAALGLDKLLPLGRVFVATPLAVFGAEHLAEARTLMRLVPAWMPARLFWTYLVGVALFAAALSLSLKKYVRLSTTLLAMMFFLFVLLIHLPNAIAHAENRIYWAIAARDLAFGGGALAFAGAQREGWPGQRSNAFVFIGRLIVALAVIFFGIENLVHPLFAPGVPLPKMTPAWVVLPALWAYLTGTVMVIAGACILLNRYSRIGATSVGMLLTLLTLFLYLPILLIAHGSSQIVEGVNYVADTLLFGGTLLLLAAAMPKQDVRPAS
jgi:uncharacterized membrane protein